MFGCDVYEHVDLAKLPGVLKARKCHFMRVPKDSPTGFVMYDINTGAITPMHSSTFVERLSGEYATSEYTIKPEKY